MKKRIGILVLLLAISLPLVACNEKSIESNVEDVNEVKDNLISDKEIADVVISKSENSQQEAINLNGTIKDEKDLKEFKNIISSAIEEKGEVRMSSPDFDINIVYSDETTDKLYLWLGEEGQISSLMKEEMNKRYSISAKSTSQLIDLLN